MPTTSLSQSQTTPSSHLTPTPPAQRIGSLDFLRGTAVLGILVINMESFAYPNPFNPYQFGFESALDTAVRFWVYFLFQGKFFSIFTLLFGAGFFIFLERAQHKLPGLGALDLYARRMLWLFAFGVIHAYLLWNGDVLYHYAVCGLLLLPLRALSVRQLFLAIGVFCAMISFSTYNSTVRTITAYHAYQTAVEVTPDQRTEEQHQAVSRWQKQTEKKSTQAAQSTIEARLSGYAANVAENAKHTQVHNGTIVYRGILFRTLLMMTLGIVLYRLGVFHDYRRLAYYWPLTFSLLGIALTVNYLRYEQWTYAYDMPVVNLWQAQAFAYTKESLGLAYVLLFNGLFQKLRRGLLLSLIANTGRMALSNYIFQSIVCMFIFYGFGAAQFNQYSRSELLIPVLLIWIIQVTASQLWLSRFERGPLESLWRTLTYAKTYATIP